MNRAKRVWPDVAIPPGATLAEEIEARGMSQAELARRMGRPIQAVNEIVRGKKAITAETALGLEDVLGTPAHFWLRLEADHQLSMARLARGRRTRRAVHSTTARAGR
jgi:HTH-type transcriptional regulator/antitoxin HigA